VRLAPLTATLRERGADDRAEALRAFGTAEPESEGAFLAVLIVDSSMQVRSVAEGLLDARPEERRTERPRPSGPLTEKDRVALLLEHAELPGFLEVLLAYTRGRDLLGRASLAGAPLDDQLLELALSSEAVDPRAVLVLPFDMSGRGVAFLDRFAELRPDARDTFLDLLVWAALQEASAIDAEDLARARALVHLWVEGLLADPDFPPTLEEFVSAGAHLQRGPTGESVTAPSGLALDALHPVGRALYLALGPPARETHAKRRPFEADLQSSLAELRVLAWRLLVRSELAGPDEVLATAADETPGVAVELLRSLPDELPPELGGPLRGLLDHPRASVRRAAAEALARSPLLAAMACADLDPRAPDAPLGLLAAQPEALRAPALTAFLEVPRPPDETLGALEALERPPPPTWTQWPGLLRHDQAPVRRAAARSLLRRPPAEGPAVASFLPRVLESAPVVALRLIDHFALAGHHADVAGILLDARVGDRAARLSVRILARYGDAAAWLTLWCFVVGEPPDAARRRWRRFGSRAARGRALDALLDLPVPERKAVFSVDPPGGGRHPAWLRAREGDPLDADGVRTLLADRDPGQLALAVRYLGRRPAEGDLGVRVYDLIQEALVRARRSRWARGLAAWWRRLGRALLPRGWVGPGGSFRGRVGGLLAALLDLAVRTGAGGVWPEDLEPLLADGPAEARDPAVRLYVAARGPGAVRRLAAHPVEAVRREALRAGHPDRVEALVVGRIEACLRGEPAADPEEAAAWVALRPRAAFAAPLVRLLGRPEARAAATRALLAVAAAGARADVAALLRSALDEAVAARDEERLEAVLDVLEAAELHDLVPAALPAVGWAREAARQRIVALLRAARDRGVPLGPDDLEPLLAHHLAQVRTLAISLLRRGDAPAWPIVRPYAPGPSQRPTGFSKHLLGVCEDEYEDGMGLVLERLLEHDNGEVARRALKLINRREREVAAATLLARLDDPELRKPILTAFATWAKRFLEKDGRLAPEVLEEERRKVRALLTLLAEDGAGQVGPVLDEALAHPVPSVRAAARFAIGRLVLEERRADVASGLAERDPAVRRAAARAAAALGPDPELDAALESLARDRAPELRAEARSALVRRLDPEAAERIESAVSDSAPEVRLAVLEACRRRPEALAALTLAARLGDPDPRVREAVLEGLKLCPPGDPEALRGALADPVPEVRRLGIEVVGAWGCLDALRHEVGEAAADPALSVSGAALDLIGREDREAVAPAGGEGAPAGGEGAPAGGEGEGEGEGEGDGDGDGDGDGEGDGDGDGDGDGAPADGDGEGEGEGAPAGGEGAGA